MPLQQSCEEGAKSGDHFASWELRGLEEEELENNAPELSRLVTQSYDLQKVKQRGVCVWGEVQVYFAGPVARGGGRVGI